MEMNMEPTPFKTSDQGLAAYLLFRDVELVGCIPSGEAGRLFFVFQDTPHRDDLIEEWTTAQGSAKEIKRFWASVKRTRYELTHPLG
jgi:hypothetical protein